MMRDEKPPNTFDEQGRPWDRLIAGRHHRVLLWLRYDVPLPFEVEMICGDLGLRHLSGHSPAPWEKPEATWLLPDN
jgi:hypothetical protein